MLLSKEIILFARAIFILKKVQECKECPKIRPERDGVSYTDTKVRKVLEQCSSLHPSEKELAEWHSFTKIPLLFPI
jgi:hypothetical protein